MNEKRCCILHSSFNFFSFSSICTIYLISNFNFLFLSCDNKPIICRNDCQRNLPDNALQTETSSRVMCSCWLRNMTETPVLCLDLKQWSAFWIWSTGMSPVLSTKAAWKYWVNMARTFVSVLNKSSGISLRLKDIS